VKYISFEVIYGVKLINFKYFMYYSEQLYEEGEMGTCELCGRFAKIRNCGRAVKCSLIIIILVLSAFTLALFPGSEDSSALTLFKNSSYSEFVNGTASNLTIESTGPDVEIKLGLEVKINNDLNWTELYPAENPGPRMTYGLANVYGTDKIVLFGGHFNNTYYNETWVYDVSDNTWTNMSPDVDPGARNRFRLVSIFGTDKLILFGGGKPDLTYFGDTWIYDLSDNTWMNMDPVIRPAARVEYGMSFIYGTDKVVLFGGSVKDDDYNYDTWEYDLSENRWFQRFQLIKPDERTESKMTSIYRDDKVFIYGGKGQGVTTLFDSWIYDYSDNEWFQVQTASSPQINYRNGLTTVYDTKEVILNGGKSGVQRTWIYNIEANTWREIFPTVYPIQRASYDMTSVYNTDSIFLYGGNSSSINRIQNDTWKMDLPIGFRTEGFFESKPFDISVASTMKTISWTADVPLGTGLKLQLRSAMTRTGLTAAGYLGPDGTAGSYYTTSGAAIWSGHRGQRWVQYRAYLNTEDPAKTPVFRNVSIWYNLWPDAVPDGPGNNTVIGDTTPLFKWLFTDPDSASQGAFRLQVDDDINFTDIDFDSGDRSGSETSWQFPAGTTYSEIPEGTWYWRVRCLDSDGDWGKYSQPFMMVIDGHAPDSAVKYPANDAFYQEVERINGTAADTPDGTGIAGVEILLKRHSDGGFWNGSAWESDEVWLTAEGKSSWSFNAASVTWTTNTSYGVVSRAVDNFGYRQELLHAVNFTIDTDMPISFIEFPENNSYKNSVPSIYGTAADGFGAGVAGVELCIHNTDEGFYWTGENWVKDESWVSASGTVSWSYESPKLKFMSDTNYRISSRAADSVGNVELQIYGNGFMFDDKPPSGLAIYINYNAGKTNSSTVELALDAKDSGSGVELMAFSQDGLTWTDWEIYSKLKEYELASGFGEYNIYFKVMDRAQNIAEPVFSSIVFLNDTDGDGVENAADAFPDDPTQQRDTDGDGYGDNGTGRNPDEFPLDPDEWKDSDKDGVGDNNDAFPFDPEKWMPEQITDDEGVAFPFYILLLLIVILVLVCVSVLSIVYKSKRQRKYFDGSFYSRKLLEKMKEDERVLLEVRDEVIEGRVIPGSTFTRRVTPALLEAKLESGEISEETFHFITAMVEDNEDDYHDQKGATEIPGEE